MKGYNPGAKLFTPEQIDDIVDAYARREDNANLIAKRMGCGKTIIKKILLSRGVRIRTRQEALQLEIAKGRRDQRANITAAWARGAYDTDAVRAARESLRGRKRSKQTRERLSDAAKQKVRRAHGEYLGYRKWCRIRERIIARDGGRCLVCGSAGGRLHVHHFDHDRSNNDARNLITLCAGCHVAYHRHGSRADEISHAHDALLVRLNETEPESC